MHRLTLISCVFENFPWNIHFYTINIVKHIDKYKKIRIGQILNKLTKQVIFCRKRPLARVSSTELSTDFVNNMVSCQCNKGLADLAAKPLENLSCHHACQ